MKLEKKRMKSIVKYGCGLLYLCLATACSEDKINESELPVIEAEYTLPQGKSEADDRIVSFYKKYGTYILYDFVEADLKWTQVEVNSGWGGYQYVPADPQYAGEVMDFLTEWVFSFYPEYFLMEILPYKIFLTSDLTDFYGQKRGAQIYSTQMVIANCSKKITKFSKAEKIAFKNELHTAFFNSGFSLFQIPEDFYKISDYTSAVTYWEPSSENSPRNRGFLADSNGNEWCYTPPFNENMDLQTYLYHLRTRTKEEWKADLAYPLVEQKYNILKEYFKFELNIDLEAIADKVE